MQRSRSGSGPTKQKRQGDRGRVRDAGGVVVPVPRHEGKAICRGTVQAIIREIGVSVDEFMELE